MVELFLKNVYNTSDQSVFSEVGSPANAKRSFGERAR